MKTVLITNIPAPYRERVYEILSEKLNGQLEIIYCAQSEPNRLWNFNKGQYKKSYLKTKKVNFLNRQVYLGSDIIKRLNDSNPDFLIISGFSLPMITSYIWSFFNKKKAIAFTDGHLEFEKKLTIFHKIARNIFYKYAVSYIGASKKSMALFKSYGAKESEVFQSHLCIENSFFSNSIKSFKNREYDIIICGRICKEKLFYYSLEVIVKLRERIPNLKVLIVGDGPLRTSLLNKMDEESITYTYTGFVTQDELPKLYSNAKVFLFPSTRDAWGVVANESCASGTPVITCSHVGAADELIINNLNGFVSPVDSSIWVDQVESLLKSEEMWEKFSKACLQAVSVYNYENSAEGIKSAIFYAKSRK